MGTNRYCSGLSLYRIIICNKWRRITRRSSLFIQLWEKSFGLFCQNKQSIKWFDERRLACDWLCAENKGVTWVGGSLVATHSLNHSKLSNSPTHCLHPTQRDPKRDFCIFLLPSQKTWLLEEPPLETFNSQPHTTPVTPPTLLPAQNGSGEFRQRSRSCQVHGAH